MTPDPIDIVRLEVTTSTTPTHADVARQRDALLDTMRQRPARQRDARRSLRRWLPASGVAVAGVASAALLAAALLPSDDGSRDSTDPTDRSGLRLVTGAGAFAGLDLETASASEVLKAAGESAAAGAGSVGTAAWTYVRLESVSPNVTVGQDGPKVTIRTIDESWTETETGRKFALSETTFPHQPAQVSLYFEDLEARTIGNVGWTANDGTAGERRATWHTDAGDGEGMVRMHLALRRQLPHAETAGEVQEVLDTVLAASNLTFRDGMGCAPRGGCSSFGGGPMPFRYGRLTPEQSKVTFGRGLLLNTTAYDVYPPETTRAIYDYLANLDGTTATPAKDGTSNVELLFTNPGAPAGTGERVVLDGDTGRIQERGRATHGGSTRWVAVGGSEDPVTGGVLCDRHPDECDELRDLAERLESDPKAQFRGVVDWMFIQQFCDGMINRDGSTNQDTDLPRSMSKDPKVKAEREACEKREAAAARRG